MSVMYGQWFHLHVRPLPTPILSYSFPPCDVKYAYFVKATEVKGRVLISVGGGVKSAGMQTLHVLPRYLLHERAWLRVWLLLCLAVIVETSKVVLYHHVRISGGHCYQHVYAHSLLGTMLDILAPCKLIAHFRIPLYNTTLIHIAPLVNELV